MSSILQDAGLLALIAAMLASTAQPLAGSTPSSWASGATLGGLAMLLQTRSWLGGIPAYAHDWKWPLNSVQLADLPHQLNSLWLPWGSGAPAIQALGNYPVTLSAWVLGHVVDPQKALMTFLIVLGAVGGLAISRCCTALLLPRPYQWVAAFCYPLLPAVFNRLNAGHLTWLLGFMLLPAAIAIAAAPVREAAAAAGRLGFVWGLAASQIQFLLFFPAIVIPLLARRSPVVVIVASLLAGMLQAPMLASLFFGHPESVFAAQHPNLYWQSAQSSPLIAAIISGADPVRYFDSQRIGSYALFAPIIAAAAFGSLHDRRVRVLGIVWILATVWSSGLQGPLAPLFSWLFIHVPQAAAFREFSHAEVLVGAPLMLLAAYGIRAAVRNEQAGAAVLALVLLPAILPGLLGRIATVTPAQRVDFAVTTAVEQVAALPGDGQVLWWPGTQPVSMNGSRGGVDPIALDAGAHAPFTEYRPTVALTRALKALEAGDPSACGLLGDLGVQAVVIRPDLQLKGLDATLSRAPSPERLTASGLQMRFRAKTITIFDVPCFRGRVTMAPLTILRGDWTDLQRLARSGATDEVTLPPPPPRGCRVLPPPQPSFTGLDVTRAYVPLSSLDAYLAKFNAAFGDVVVTAQSGLSLNAPFALSARAGKPFEWERSDSVRKERGAIAIWERASGCELTSVIPPRVIPESAAPLQAVRLSKAAATIHAGVASLLVLHQSIDAAWSLETEGERQLERVQADGYAIGWIVDPGTWNVRLRYAGPPPVLLWCIVIVALLACGGFFLVKTGRVEFRASSSAAADPLE